VGLIFLQSDQAPAKLNGGVVVSSENIDFVHLTCGTVAVVDKGVITKELSVISNDDLICVRIADLRWSLLGPSGRQHIGCGYLGHFVMLHRLIVGAAPKMHVDHIDGNPLNNRLRNLRQCSNQQNIRNMRSKGGSSKFKGVSKAGSRWVARIMVDGVDVRRKSFRSEIEAARQYDLWAAEIFGEFAWLNCENFEFVEIEPREASV